jgi:hypothetical protein
MIAICTNYIQVIMLSSNPYTLLAVGSTKTWRLNIPKEHTFELQSGNKDKTFPYNTVTSYLYLF